MRRLLDKNTVPPGSFRYVDPDTGYTVRAEVFSQFLQMCRDHRRANNLDVPADFDAQVEDQLCHSIPPEWCQYAENEARTWFSPRFGWQEVKAWATAVLAVFKSGFALAPQPEAERRAAICVACPANLTPEGCGSCGRLAQISRMFTGEIVKRSTSQDHRLRACAVCSCPLNVIVHFPLKVLESKTTPEQQATFPEFCWQKIGFPNYVPDEVWNSEARNPGKELAAA